MKGGHFHKLLIAVFLCAIFLPHLLWPLAQDFFAGEQSENRNLAERPAFTLSGIETYPREFEAYYDDHIPFRQALITLYNRLQVELFGVSPNEDVILGREDWLFYNSVYDGNPLACYTGEKMYSEDELAAIAKNLENIKARVDAVGAEFVVFLVPNKERMYAEYMPAYYGDPAPVNVCDQVSVYLTEHTDIRVVDAYGDLMAYKQAHPELDLYYRTDTHWNSLGAYIGAKTLVNALGGEMTPADALEIRETPFAPGDLAGMLGIAKYVREDKEYEITGYPRQGQFTQEGTKGQELFYTCEGAPEKRLFMIFDSFYMSLAPHLATQFEESRLVHYTKMADGMMETWKPDVVVFEVTERYIDHLGQDYR